MYLKYKYNKKCTFKGEKKLNTQNIQNKNDCFKFIQYYGKNVYIT